MRSARESRNHLKYFVKLASFYVEMTVSAEQYGTVMWVRGLNMKVPPPGRGVKDVASDNFKSNFLCGKFTSRLCLFLI